MPRKNRQRKRRRENRADIRRKVNETVAEVFPGCVAEFTGGVSHSRMAIRGRTFGFRIKSVRSGKYRSNMIWVNPDFVGTWPVNWLRRAVKTSGG